MRSKSSFLIVCVLLTGSCLAGGGASEVRDSGSSGEQENPFAAQPEAIMAGRKLFLRNCSHCHGPDGFGRKKAANLHSALIQNAPPGALFDRIRNGNLRAGMPSWSHLPDQQIWQLVSYIESLRDEPGEKRSENSQLQR